MRCPKCLFPPQCVNVLVTVTGSFGLDKIVQVSMEIESKGSISLKNGVIEGCKVT